MQSVVSSVLASVYLIMMARLLRTLANGLLLVASLSAALVAALVAGPARAQDVLPVPPLAGGVSVIDQTGTLTPAQSQALSAKLDALEARRGTQVVVLLVPTTQPEDIASYGQRVANAWKIGHRARRGGLVIVVAKNDRRVRIEVAKTLKGAIPDLAAKRVIDAQITPAFRAGDFAGGLNAAVDQLTAHIDGEGLPKPAARGQGQGQGLTGPVPLAPGALVDSFKEIGKTKHSVVSIDPSTVKLDSDRDGGPILSVLVKVKLLKPVNKTHAIVNATVFSCSAETALVVASASLGAQDEIIGTSDRQNTIPWVKGSDSPVNLIMEKLCKGHKKPLPRGVLNT